MRMNAEWKMIFVNRIATIPLAVTHAAATALDTPSIVTGTHVMVCWPAKSAATHCLQPVNFDFSIKCSHFSVLP